MIQRGMGDKDMGTPAHGLGIGLVLNLENHIPS